MIVILISGSINSGKTTVGHLLAARVPKTAHVNVDSLRHFVSWMPLQESIPLSLKNAASVARNFLAHGLNVVITYPLMESDYRFLVDQFEGASTEIHGVTLAPELRVALQNRGDRELTETERSRIREQYEHGLHQPGFGNVIDNSCESPEETTQRILRVIGWQPST